MSELKPCPFCGGKARHKVGRYNLLGGYGGPETAREWHAIYCTECGISQPKKKYNLYVDAVRAWNRQTVPGSRDSLIRLLGRLEHQYCVMHSITRENVVDYLLQKGVTVARCEED